MAEQVFGAPAARRISISASATRSNTFVGALDAFRKWRHGRGDVERAIRAIVREEIERFGEAARGELDRSLAATQAETLARVQQGLDRLRETPDEEPASSGVVRTGFAVLADDLHKMHRRIGELEAQLRAVGDRVRQEREELLVQFAYCMADLKRAITAALDGLPDRIEAGSREATVLLEGVLAQVTQMSGLVEAVSTRMAGSHLSELLREVVSQPLELVAAVAGEGRNWAEDSYKWARQTHDAVALRLDALEREKLPEMMSRLPELTRDLISVQFDSLSAITSEARTWAEEAYKWARQAHDGTETRLNIIQNEKLVGLAFQVHHVIALQLSLRTAAKPSDADTPSRPNRYKRARASSFEAYLARAEREFPKVFPLWWDRLENHRRATDSTKIGNVANEHDLYSTMFKDFVKLHARGRVLDIGCGNFGRPLYLREYPSELISAIEPLPMKESPDFDVIRGIGEYLPWPESSFSTVISATALDHCLSLERSWSEIKRVLATDGVALLWIDLVPGAPPYEPAAPEFKPADQFHLFHFSKNWLEPMIDQDFRIIERIECDMLSFYSKAFYLLAKRP